MQSDFIKLRLRARDLLERIYEADSQLAGGNADPSRMDSLHCEVVSKLAAYTGGTQGDV